MSSNATVLQGRGERSMEFVVDEVFVFINKPFCFPDWLILRFQI